MTLRKVMSTALAPALAFAALAAGCSKPKAPDTLYFSMANEPPELNSTKATDQESSFVLGHVMEGLTRVGATGQQVPGVAERWNLTDQGATFFLRKDAKWSDGKTVTAHDFVFAWQTVVDPKNASEYAFILFPVKNAEAIVQGKSPVASLGVKASDDFTLEVKFEKPCGYFLALTSFTTYFPIREEFYSAQGGKYGAEAEKLLFNGPFRLTQWVHGASLEFEKNDAYWNRDQIHLKLIKVPYITSDTSARLNLFKDGKIDLLDLGKNSLEDALNEEFKMKRYLDGSVWYLQYNFSEGRITRNKNLRKAIQALFDPSEYVNKVVAVPGSIPGSTLIPQWLGGKSTQFRQEYPVAPSRPNIALAKSHMDTFLKETGQHAPVSLVWLTGDTPGSAKEAEYFQNLFKKHLGIELRIDKQIFKQRLAKMLSGEFDIVAAGWGPDYADPMTFADLFTSWNENNRGKWKNDAYDALIRRAQGTTNPVVRMDSMAAAEKILLEDQAILPTFEKSTVYTHSDRLSGFRRRSVGFDPDFTAAKIIETQGAR